MRRRCGFVGLRSAAAVRAAATVSGLAKGEVGAPTSVFDARAPSKMPQGSGPFSAPPVGFPTAPAGYPQPVPGVPFTPAGFETSDARRPPAEPKLTQEEWAEINARRPRPSKVSAGLMSNWENIDGLNDPAATSAEPNARAPLRVPRIFSQFVRANEGLGDLENYHNSLVAGNSGPTLGSTLRMQDQELEKWVPLSEQLAKIDMDNKPIDIRGPEAAPMTAEERARFLNRSGKNPYDTYHGEKVPPSLQEGVSAATEDMAKATVTSDQIGQSPEFQSFLKHMRLQAGIAGPVAPVLRYGMDPSNYSMPDQNLPLATDPQLTKLQRILSDFDYSDRRMTNHVCMSYPGGTNVLAVITCALFSFMYWWQREHNWMAFYDEFVGLDIRKHPDAEKPLLCLITFALMRLLFFHPATVLSVVTIRYYRMMRGLPIGPP